ncbi:MAG TPA: chitobiase/beta-hexosaminidase C-terminal domain-containing protein, partial [Planctomycetota bacterium]|nr:chitobiase/beta-hexosaminidase C-terminal domain-containing protein [Planctomycetota bacterium]
TAYGAVAGDDNDDTAAFTACVTAAKAQGKIVWIPAGIFQLTGAIALDHVTVRGAGMWRTTLVGNSDYANTSKRLTFTGGDQVHLADFAITGRLNYRNDGEANDGLGGSYGNGSTIARLWIEHTKVGAWIVNSTNLTVSGCRFRNTIADGINLSVGMRSCTINDCTARGTGDDAFALWPATYMPATYAPGLNVISHCTAQIPCLGNGVGIYGGEGNCIEDCRFTDIPHNCSVLLSTAFGNAVFSGQTIVRRSDLLRAGGYDYSGNAGAAEDAGNAYKWRGSMHVVPVQSGIANVRLQDLVITDSASDGVSFNSNNSAVLSDAVMERVTISGAGRRGNGYGLREWSDARGGITLHDVIVSGSATGGWRDDSPPFILSIGVGNSGWTTAAAVATPILAPNSGVVSAGTAVTITTATGGAAIRYTIDGSAPTSSSPVYSTPLVISANTTVRAQAVKTGMESSAVTSTAFTVSAPPMAVVAPVFSPNGGTVTSGQSVTLTSATSGATIRYTTDGSTPNGSSAVYASALIISATTTLRTYASKSGMSDSAVVSAAFTVAAPPAAVATPVFSPAGGAVPSGQSVTISSATSGAAIRYTTDGSTPTAASSAYTTALIISATMTLRAYASKSGMSDSAVVSATFTVAGSPPPPTPAARSSSASGGGCGLG